MVKIACILYVRVYFHPFIVMRGFITGCRDCRLLPSRMNKENGHATQCLCITSKLKRILVLMFFPFDF